jgi:pimeloyl-ACP methyl ester carboxylesterase
MSGRRRVAWLPLIAAVALGGCVGNRIYRPGPDTDPARAYFLREHLTTRDIEPIDAGTKAWPYRLGFVEFDDRGELFLRDQLTRTLAEIARARQDAKALGRPAVVAVFVHGWKNNASDTSGNVWGFRQVLAGLSKQYSQANDPEPLPVVGVYIGWRGAVLSPPILKEFTFYDRQRKSQNLPGAHLVETLITIMQAAKGVDYADTGAATTILIGHSFGGAVLETALTQTLVGLAAEAKARQQPIRWPATLIVFVNEAQEATRSFQLIESFEENLPARDGGTCLPPGGTGGAAEPDPPAIVSISSVGDTATRVAYGAAQAVRRPFNSLRKYPQPNFLGISDQRAPFMNTTAHMGAFKSHLLGECRCTGPTDAGGHCLKVSDLVCEDRALQEALAVCPINLDTVVAAKNYLLVAKPGAMNRTPYWALQMPTTIVPDHSTIFTPVFRNFLISLIEMTQQTQARRTLASGKE